LIIFHLEQGNGNKQQIQSGNKGETSQLLEDDDEEEDNEEEEIPVKPSTEDSQATGTVYIVFTVSDKVC